MMKKNPFGPLIRLLLVLAMLFPSLPNHAFCAAISDRTLPAPDKIHYQSLRFELPDTQRVVLENGIVLYILENHDLPLINISALIKTGTMYDPEGKEGTAELTAYVMRTGGTDLLKSAELDNQLDQMAAKAAITMSMESAQASFAVLNKHLDRGLDLLSQMLIHPVFEQEKFELARQLTDEELRRLKDDPQKLAFREFNRLMYSGDPRGRLSSHQSLAKIERGDLIDFHDRFFQPGNIMFAVSGDITKNEAVTKFNRYFGGWKTKGLPVEVPPPPSKFNAGVYFIDKEIPQSTIITGRFAAGKNSPDFYAFTLLDFIMGSGGFPSRIVSVVRNNEGLAYSAGSFYRAKPAYGVFGTYAFTKTSTTLKAWSLLDAELQNIKSKAITAGETDWAKKSINDGFIFSFSTPERIVWQQMNLEYDKLPPDFLLNYRNRIENVTLEDLKRVAVKYLNGEKNIVLILGDSKKFDKPSKATDPPVFVTPEE